jgi:hypothetical protein
MTPHKLVNVEPFMDSAGKPDPGRMDRECTECGAMYLDAPEEPLEG